VLIALYLRQADLDGEEARALLGELRRSQPESEGAEQIVTFTPAGKRMALPLEDGAEHSMLFPVPEGTFDVVVVSPQLRFFTNEWSRAFLAQLVSSLRPSGSLWVPILSKRGDDGLWSERWLTQTLGVKASLATSLPLLRFDRIPALSPASSILEWYFREHAAAMVEDYLYSTSGAPQIAEPQPKAAPVARTIAGEVADSVPFASHLERFASTMTYSVTGASYKSMLLSYILEKELPGRTGLRVLDMGGGMGMVATELVLTSGRVDQATVCDPLARNSLVMARLGRFFGERVQDRLELRISRAEDFRYPGAFDLITFIGSLLYVPREARQQVIASAFDALAPGGLLVVHENIKSPTYTKDFDVMFSVEEIDALLGNHGRIERYLSTATRAVTREAAGSKTVFRSVRK